MPPPIETSWSSVPWSRPAGEQQPPPVNRSFVQGLLDRIKGRPDDARAVVDVGLIRDLAHNALGSTEPIYGAQIHDHDRGVTYSVTLDPETSEIDYLQVTISGAGLVDENALRRVPVERIRRAVLEQLRGDARARAEHGPDAFTFAMPGTLSDDQPRRARSAKPNIEDVADLMERGLDRHALATRYGAKLRTVDRWMTQARRTLAQRDAGQPTDTPPTLRQPRESETKP